MTSIFLFGAFGFCLVLALACGLSLMTSPVLYGASADRENEPDPEPSISRNLSPDGFVALIGTGPNWIDGRNYKQQPWLLEHYEYMKELHSLGVLQIGGPFLDGPAFTGIPAIGPAGFVLLHAKSLEEARSVVAADPAIKRGTLRAVVHPWWNPLSAKH